MAKIQLTKEQQQALVLAVLFLGGGGWAFFKYFWLPVSDEIGKTRKEIQRIDGEIKTAKTASVKRKKIQEELDKLKLQAEAAEKRLPQELDMPKVIETITDLTARHNVNLLTIAPGPPSTQAYFVEVPFMLSIQATYHDLGRFFAAIALEERIYSVRAVTFGAPDTAGIMSVAFTLISYKYKG